MHKETNTGLVIPSNPSIPQHWCCQVGRISIWALCIYTYQRKDRSFESVLHGKYSLLSVSGYSSTSADEAAPLSDRPSGSASYVSVPRRADPHLSLQYGVSTTLKNRAVRTLCLGYNFPSFLLHLETYSTSLLDHLSVFTFNHPNSFAQYSVRYWGASRTIVNRR